MNKRVRKIDFTSRLVAALDFIRRVEDMTNRVFRHSEHEEVRRRSRASLERFNVLRERFPVVYEQLKGAPDRSMVSPLWSKFEDELAASMLPFPRTDFLRDATLLRTMVIGARHRWVEKELEFMKGQWDSDGLERLLSEDAVGGPQLLRGRYLTSPTMVHSGHHIARWEKSTGVAMASIDSIVEWGGGYGNLAKMISRMAPQVTYAIVDLPLLAALQWLYLSSVLGEDRVFLPSSDEPHREGVNLVPVHSVSETRLKADMFISTWGLSESNREAADLVLTQEAFGAKHILMAYTISLGSSPLHDSIERLIEVKRASVEDITFLPGNKYAFK